MLFRLKMTREQFPFKLTGMKRIIPVIVAAVIIFSSCRNTNTIAEANDYDRFLQPGLVQKKADTVQLEIAFWEKRLAADTGSFVNMAELAKWKLRLFKLNGDIKELKEADGLLEKSSAKLNHTRPELLYSRSQTSITQHQFVNAAEHIAKAEKAGGDAYTVCLLRFDVLMELGKFAHALKSLESLKDKSSFDYLVRRAKWEDHSGRLDKAIVLMEEAFEKVKDKNKGLYNWVRSNLGDMYGHAGRVEEAYRAYLDVLEKDPADLYCLKGIAWIAYSHDANTNEAKRILQYILSQTSMPDLKLMLADIAASENDEAGKKKWQHEFVSTVTRPEYGDMYNKYLISLYTENVREYGKAYAIASKEMNNRFTPETCSWMAWVEYKRGNNQKALELARAFVHNKTFEPDALISTAFIYAANGKKAEAKKLLEECLESEFEIGPLQTKEIKEKLALL